MGLQDRQYYRDDSYQSPWSSAPSASQSVIVTIIVINVAIFVLDMFSPVSPVPENAPPGFQSQSHVLSEFLALKSNLFLQPWNFWQLLSYGFAHASINSPERFFHVGGNMLMLFILGRPVEQRLGRSEFIKFYLIAIIVAGIGFLLLNTGAPGVVGASGAVSAVIALFIFMYPQQTLLLFGIIPIKAWALGVAAVAIDLLRSLNPESPIAWQAHLTGFAFGAAYFYWKWNFNRIRLEKVTQIFNPGPRLKVHRANQNEQLSEQADQILEKIKTEGEESLSAKERKILKKYSQHLRGDRD